MKARHRSFVSRFRLAALLLVLPSASATAQTTHTISNGDITVGISLTYGASIRQLDFRTGGVININNVDNADNTGRQIQAAFYDAELSGTTDCWPVQGACSPNPACTWGWNPVQAGDACGAGSPAQLLVHTGTRIVTRTFPRQWNPFWSSANFVMDQDIEILSSNVVKITYTFTNNETFVVNRTHELPVAYLGWFYDRGVHYEGNAPWTNAPVTVRSFAPDQKWNLTTATENWAGFININNTRPTCELYIDECNAMLLYVPDFNAFNMGRMADGPTLLQAWQDVTLQPGETKSITAYMAVGDFSDARAAVYALRGGGQPGPGPGFGGGTPYNVSLQADNGMYVVAEDNGGGAVNANRTAIGAWEMFTLRDLNGGTLDHGDQIVIETGAGWFFRADGGGGAGLDAAAAAVGSWETFTIEKQGGGTITNGAIVAIRAGSGHYMVAEGGGGAEVNANRGAWGPWETFTLIIR